MSNEEFLKRLEAVLAGRVPQEDVDDAMNYHREYFAEAGENAAAELPAPEAVAEQIIREREEYLRKRQFQWAKPAIIGVICVGLVVMVAVSIVTKNFFHNLWDEYFRAPEIRRTGITQVVEADVTEPAYLGTAVYDEVTFTTFQSGNSISVYGELPPLNGIMIEGVSDNVSVTAGTDYRLDITYSDRENLDYVVDDGMLHIVGAMKSVLGYQGGQINLVVPANLDVVSIDVDMGNIILDGVSADTAELNTNMGNISVNNGTFNALDCDSDMGDVAVYSVESRTLNCSCDTGNVEATEFTALETDLETGLGNVTAIAVGSERDYQLSLEVALGEVKVDGQKESNDYQTTVGSRMLEAQADVGNVTVDFTGTSDVPAPPDPPSPPEAPSLDEVFN